MESALRGRTIFKAKLHAVSASCPSGLRRALPMRPTNANCTGHKPRTQHGRAAPQPRTLPAVTGTADRSISESSCPQAKFPPQKELGSGPPLPRRWRTRNLPGPKAMPTSPFRDPSAVDAPQRGGRKHEDVTPPPTRLYRSGLHQKTRDSDVPVQPIDRHGQRLPRNSTQAQTGPN